MGAQEHEKPNKSKYENSGRNDVCARSGRILVQLRKQTAGAGRTDVGDANDRSRFTQVVYTGRSRQQRFQPPWDHAWRNAARVQDHVSGGPHVRRKPRQPLIVHKFVAGPARRLLRQRRIVHTPGHFPRVVSQGDDDADPSGDNCVRPPRGIPPRARLRELPERNRRTALAQQSPGPGDRPEPDHAHGRERQGVRDV